MSIPERLYDFCFFSLLPFLQASPVGQQAGACIATYGLRVSCFFGVFRFRVLQRYGSNDQRGWLEKRAEQTWFFNRAFDGTLWALSTADLLVELPWGCC
ncbi:hypothetical protein N656DRAFT_424111 [Canariomyces notabilis]|uniref:Secreted protein n=1 Tax=Canariomyces notabilis TaxID=2074819 RepID=A0AAN6QGX3_9PEZI|nr:hypothetical protein N656DRAFT_424111 [Canariomyces arenarius]